MKITTIGNGTTQPNGDIPLAQPQEAGRPAHPASITITNCVIASSTSARFFARGVCAIMRRITAGRFAGLREEVITGAPLGHWFFIGYVRSNGGRGRRSEFVSASRSLRAGGGVEDPRFGCVGVGEDRVGGELFSDDVCVAVE